MFKFVLLFVFLSCLVSVLADGDAASTASTSQVSKSQGPPAFFLQDPNDGLCLAGGKYKRCSINTLFYVTGKAGSYSVHHRAVDEDDEDSCLDKALCHEDESPAQLANCGHCGAKKWNIVGDNDSGYVLTENNNKNCLKRVGDDATVIKCSKGYSGLSLQFATKEHISAMSGDGARLISAAFENDISAVKAFVKKGVDVDSRDWDNLTALISAAGKGHLPIVKYLVQNKADVNVRDKDNITALMEAAMHNHKNVAEYLVNSKAEIEASAVSGVTSLWLAAGEGHTDVVKLLLAKKADPNNLRVDNITVLMAGAAGGHAEVVDMLLKAKADPNLRDKDGLTALINAAEQGNASVVRSLVAYNAQINIVSSTSFSPLIVAAAHGHLEAVQTLVDAGAIVDMEHEEGVTALMYAAAGGFPDVCSYLLQKGAQVNRKHKQGGSALIEAATNGTMAVMEVLLNAGADVQIVDDDGVTALMSAASQGHVELSKLLINKGIPVGALAKSGGTAIMFAAGGGHDNAVKLLLEHGADVNIVVHATPEYIEQVIEAIAEGREDVEPHKDGVTALMVAAQGGHMESVRLLVEAGAAVDVMDDEDVTPLLNAVKGNFAQVSEYLVQHGANPNDEYVDEKKESHNLLMDAVAVNNTAFSLLLLDKGATTTHVDADGVTVLTQAAFQGQLAVVNKLLSLNADDTIANKEGINPLIAASSEGHTEVVKVLLAHNRGNQGSVDTKDKDGTNALMASSVRGHSDIVKLLIEAGAAVNEQNVDGHTALMFAYNGKNQVETLRHKYNQYMKDENDNSTRIIQDALQTHIDVVTLLQSSGADVGLKDKDGNTADDFDYKAPMDPIEIETDTPLEGLLEMGKEEL